MEVKCSCGKMLSVAESLQGTKGACPFCHSEVEYPAREKRTGRIVISLGGKGTIDGQGSGRVTSNAKLSELDSAAKKKVLKAILLSIAAVAAVFLSIWFRGHTRGRQYAESREGIFRGVREGEASTAEGSSLKAWHYYRASRSRIHWYLAEVDPEDEELQQLLTDLDARIAELDAAKSTGGGGTSSTGTGSRPPPKPPVRPGPGDGVFSDAEREHLLAVLSSDPSAVYLGLPPSLDAGGYMVVGLGIYPGSAPEDLAAIWGEPARRTPIPDEPGHTVWTYERADGFEVHVRDADETQGTKARIERIQIYPNFIGTVSGASVLGTTAAHWQRTVGHGVEGSSGMLIQYTEPFAGWVSFDRGGRFTQLRILFQERN